MNNNCAFTSLTIVYILQLEDDCWYVGFTSNLNARLAEHFGYTGRYKSVRWVDLHKPINLHKVLIGNKDDEDRITLEYMEIYGKDKVRGGKWTKIHLKRNRPVMINYILRQVSGVLD